MSRLSWAASFMRLLRSTLVVGALLTLETAAFGDGDPYLEWRTLETAHFRIHYHSGLGPIAERVASVAEGANRRLEKALGSTVSEVTEIVLNDFDDRANGSASALPYNTIRLYVTAPDDLAELSDYDDWYTTLVTHEHTHIVHTDNVG